MRRLIAVLAVLALAGCGAKAATSTQAYDDSGACQAFYTGSTTGIPNGQFDYTGEDTSTWVYQRIGDADPTLTNLIDTWYQAWQTAEADLGQPGDAPPSNTPIQSYCQQQGDWP
jgi:hypothetical protein